MSEIRCNGSASPRNSFSEKTLVSLRRKLDAMRPYVKAEMQSFDDWRFFGSRCSSNDTLVVRIESVTDEATYLKDPDKWVMASYLDCLGADHWYTYEKQWD